MLRSERRDCPASLPQPGCPWAGVGGAARGHCPHRVALGAGAAGPVPTRLGRELTGCLQVAPVALAGSWCSGLFLSRDLAEDVGQRTVEALAHPVSVGDSKGFGYVSGFVCLCIPPQLPGLVWLGLLCSPVHPIALFPHLSLPYGVRGLRF